MDQRKGEAVSRSSTLSPFHPHYEIEMHSESQHDWLLSEDTTEIACRCRRCRGNAMMNSLYLLTANRFEVTLDQDQ
jgi:hypothetical protein